MEKAKQGGCNAETSKAARGATETACSSWAAAHQHVAPWQCDAQLNALQEEANPAYDQFQSNVKTHWSRLYPWIMISILSLAKPSPELMIIMSISVRLTSSVNSWSSYHRDTWLGFCRIVIKSVHSEISTMRSNLMNLWSHYHEDTWLKFCRRVIEILLWFFTIIRFLICTSPTMVIIPALNDRIPDDDIMIYQAYAWY